VIIKSVEFIGLATASLSVPWTKFLLHGVPTHLDLEVIRCDVEGYCSGAKLGQTPRWLATEADRKDKPASTIVLAFVGSVSFTELGGRTIRVRNRSCNMTKYISFRLKLNAWITKVLATKRILQYQPCLCSMCRRSSNK
jgi:hypothetical protein